MVDNVLDTLNWKDVEAVKGGPFVDYHWVLREQWYCSNLLNVRTV